jgi:hypothetical protein
MFAFHGITAGFTNEVTAALTFAIVSFAVTVVATKMVSTANN